MDGVSMFLEALIAIGLLPVLINFISEANITGTTGVLVNLIPVLYVILLVAGFAYAFKRYKK